MLRALVIRQIALIRHAELTFGEGVSVFTGETGAGKTILLKALSFAAGMRPGAGLIRPGADKGSVTAVFALPPQEALELLQEADVELAEDGELTLRRTLDASGKSRAFVNDCPVSAGLLKSLGASLLEICGQHDQRGLMDPSCHEALLDAYASLQDRAKTLRPLYDDMRKADRALEEFRRERETLARERDFYAFAVKELETLAPEPGLEAKLEERRRKLKNRERILAARAALEAATYGGGEDGASLATLFSRAHGAASELGKYDEAVAKLADRLQELRYETEAAAEEALRLTEDDEADASDQEATDDRLFALKAAARKYKAETDALPALLESMRGKLSASSDMDGEEKKLEADAAKKRLLYLAEAETLHQAREEAAPLLGEALTAELRSLKMERAEARAEVTRGSESKTGISSVRFLLKTNPGSPFAPPAAAASGGELSRCLLGFKAVLADDGAGKTLIFDEIDAGVSGAVSEAVGRKLKALGKRHSVLAVTHQPQTASLADAHFLISKRAEGEETETSVQALTDDERREELSRLLSGEVVTEEARRAAEKMLMNAAEFTAETAAGR